MDENVSDEESLIRRANDGDLCALDAIFDQYRRPLLRMIQIRLDCRLQSRLDASDILQNAYLQALKRLKEYVADQKIPVLLWLRMIVGEELINLHRHHLGTQMRNAAREVSLYREALPTASSLALAEQLLANDTSPSQAAVRAERLIRLRDALNKLDPIDREVLALRHFEELTHAETAQVLNLEMGTAAKRYIRALRRLKKLLTEISDGLENL